MSSRLLSKVAESRFFTTSLLIHAALISLLGSVVLFKVTQEKTSFIVSENSGFLQETEKVDEVQAESPSEFSEPEIAQTELAPAPSVQSAISSLTDSQASWSTPVNFAQMSVGPSLSSSQPMASSVTGPAATTSRLGALGKSSSFTFMGIKSDSRRVAFLLDASGSMILDSKGGGAAYAALKSELISLVDQLNPETEFNVIMFGAGSADTFQPQAVPASPKNVGELREWLEPYMKEKAGILRQTYTKTRLVGARGTTRLDIALEAAFEMQAETIFILTDGTPNVACAPSDEAVRKWEEHRKKIKPEADRYEKELAEYNTKFKTEIEQAKKKAAEMNASVSGRSKESYNWTSFAPPLPEMPAGYQRPTTAIVADDFNRMMKEMHQEYYASSRMPMPAVNVIGYYVNDGTEKYLKDMTRNIPGKFKSFKK